MNQKIHSRVNVSLAVSAKKAHFCPDKIHEENKKNQKPNTRLNIRQHRPNFVGSAENKNKKFKPIQQWIPLHRRIFCIIYACPCAVHNLCFPIYRLTKETQNDDELNEQCKHSVHGRTEIWQLHFMKAHRGYNIPSESADSLQVFRSFFLNSLSFSKIIDWLDNGQVQAHGCKWPFVHTIIIISGFYNAFNRTLRRISMDSLITRLSRKSWHFRNPFA